ncbi:MAG: VanZ family protein, partial [Oscillospiraceae bacterium]|nr:VanZ family protein [Oscillospiraceae bacterium]
NIWWNIFYGGGPIEGALFSGEFNFVPTVLKWLRGEWMPGSWTVEMLIGNSLMLVPTGVLLPLAFPRLRGWALLLLTVVIPVAIELLQPLVGRSFDVDDVISNFVGMGIGCLVAVGIRGIVTRKTGRTTAPGR